MSGRRRSTPRCSSRGNARPGVDDDDLAAELVDGHVLPDLAEAAERDDAQASLIVLSVRASEPSRAARRRRLEQPEPLEAVANRVALVVRRLDERQAEAADLVSEEVQRRT